jgi:hypothetical protein
MPKSKTLEAIFSRFKILTILLISLIALLNNVNAQNSYIKDRINAKVSFSKYLWMGPFPIMNKYTPCFEVEGNYGLLNFLEVGAYLGYSQYQKVIVVENSDTRRIIYSHLPFYGINANFHLLPFIVKKDNFWIDLYLSSKVGGYYFWNGANNSSARKNNLDYGIYGGLAAYPGKHWGLFLEYGYGNNTNWRTGLSFKF